MEPWLSGSLSTKPAKCTAVTTVPHLLRLTSFELRMSTHRQDRLLRAFFIIYSSIFALTVLTIINGTFSIYKATIIIIVLEIVTYLWCYLLSSEFLTPDAKRESESSYKFEAYVYASVSLHVSLWRRDSPTDDFKAFYFKGNVIGIVLSYVDKHLYGCLRSSALFIK